MSVTMSKPPKPVKVTKTGTGANGVRWRSPEERREARRKIAAIRRENELKHLELTSGRLDAKLLRSPKVILGLLGTLLLMGALVLASVNRPTLISKADPLPGQIASARRSLAVVAQAMTYYRVHTKSWPAQNQGLWALARNPGVDNWRGPYINAPFLDPWKQPFVYIMPVSPFETPELYSTGPDKKPGTDDDLRMTPDDFFCDEGTWKRDDTPEASEAIP